MCKSFRIDFKCKYFNDLICQHTCCTTLGCHVVINLLQLSSRLKSSCSIPLEGISLFSLCLKIEKGIKDGMVVFLNHHTDNLLHKWPLAIPTKPIHKLITSC